MQQKRLVLIAIVALIVFGTILLVYKSQKVNTNNVTNNDSITPVSSPVLLSGEIISPISPISPLVDSNVNAITENLFVLVEKANAHYSIGNYKEAIEIFSQTIDINPLPPLYNDRGNAYLALGDFKNALKDYEKAIELDPAFGSAYYNRGRLNRLQGNYEDSIADLEKSLELNPSLAYTAYTNIALSLYAQKKYEQAKDAIDTAIAADSSRKITAYRVSGDISLAMENYEAAIKDYQIALDQNPDYDMALLGLGQAYYKISDYKNARDTILHALKLQPKEPNGWFYLGLTQFALGDTTEADKAYRQGISVIEDLETEEIKSVLELAIVNLQSLALQFPEKESEAKKFIELIRSNQ